MNDLAAAAACFEIHVPAGAGEPKILILTEYVNATYFISFDIPLKHLRQQRDVGFSVMSQGRVAQLGIDKASAAIAELAPDVIVFTRYGQPTGLQLLAQARQLGIPTIYHIDDDLLELPASLGEEITKRNGAIEVVGARTRLLKECDFIYASTPELAKRLQQRAGRSDAYCGIYASYLGDILETRQAPAGRATTIGYMGSKGHQNDLMLAVPALVALMQEFPDLRFETFGTIAMPPELASFGPRVASHRVNTSYLEFVHKLAGLNWDLGLAPLVDEAFNHCKAPTKYIEYTSAGIPVVASDVNVYRDVVEAGCGWLVKDSEWENALRSAMADSDARTAALHGAREYCANEFSVGRLATQLQSVLRMALESRRAA